MVYMQQWMRSALADDHDVFISVIEVLPFNTETETRKHKHCSSPLHIAFLCHSFVFSINVVFFGKNMPRLILIFIKLIGQIK